MVPGQAQGNTPRGSTEAKAASVDHFAGPKATALDPNGQVKNTAYPKHRRATPSITRNPNLGQPNRRITIAMRVTTNHSRVDGRSKDR